MKMAMLLAASALWYWFSSYTLYFIRRRVGVGRQRPGHIPWHHQNALAVGNVLHRDHRGQATHSPKMVTNRAGLLIARHVAIIQWASSRHTPTVSNILSAAVVLWLALLDRKVPRSVTQSHAASTRRNPVTGHLNCQDHPISMQVGQPKSGGRLFFWSPLKRCPKPLDQE